ncbi:MAG: hypothetical protein B7X06_02800 [Verrucomicrobia bacterium 21-51-4]|nr:MAG: hypothetical protein B7X06_02800 [Verrucomicrobia bacterium 21-51-4]HQU09354.1 RsmE family RNA methyltransferase [Opitutales bacterium]
MNLILVPQQNPVLEFEPHSPQSEHLLRVLRLQVGGHCFVGVPQGPRGKATVEHIDAGAVTLGVVWEADAPPLFPIELIIGLPRPQSARKILNTAATLGVSHIHFFEAQKAEPSYRKSTLWSTDEWRTQLQLGAEQAFATTYPTVTHYKSLEELLPLCAAQAHRLALDVYESPIPLGSYLLDHPQKIYLAIGPERGWSAQEREWLRAQPFSFAHLGPRVQRVETAMATALGWILARGGFWG